MSSVVPTPEDRRQEKKEQRRILLEIKDLDPSSRHPLSVGQKKLDKKLMKMVKKHKPVPIQISCCSQPQLYPASFPVIYE